MDSHKRPAGSCIGTLPTQPLHCSSWQPLPWLPLLPWHAWNSFANCNCSQDYKVHIKHTDGSFEYVPYFCLPGEMFS